MNLSVHNVSQSYGPTQALRDFSLEVEDARCVAFIGPSGGGKSTALRQLCGLESPDAGTIQINDRALSRDENALHAFRKTVGIVFQAYNMFPHLDALDNITLPLVQVHGLTPAKAESRARDLLERFQLGPHSHKQPAQLSGGQAQRVAIVRALAPNPQLLFFDEPTSALDPEMTAEVLDVIKALIDEGKDVITVTHEMGFARQVAHEVAFIANGRVVEHASSQTIFETPQKAETQRFLSRVLKY